MDDRTKQVVGEIVDARTALDRDLTAFQQRVEQEANWQAQFHKHTWLVLGCSALAGLLISALLPRP